jgi:hypothetical protein
MPYPRPAQFYSSVVDERTEFNRNSPGNFVHDWGRNVMYHSKCYGNELAKNALEQLLFQMFDFIKEYAGCWAYLKTPSADIRQIVYWMGKLSEKPNLFSPNTLQAISLELPNVVRLAFSIEKYLARSLKPFQEMSNTLYGLGQLVQAKWLTHFDEDFNQNFVRLLNAFADRSHSNLPIFNHSGVVHVESQPQNISSVFYVFHMMKDACLFPGLECSNLAEKLLSVFFAYNHISPGQRMSQDFRFVLQGISAMVKNKFLPETIDLTMLFDTMPSLLLRVISEKTNKIDEQLEYVLSCLAFLARTKAHKISQNTFNSLLHLMDRWLSMKMVASSERSKHVVVDLIDTFSESAEWFSIDDKEKLRTVIASQSSLTNRVVFETLQAFILSSSPSSLSGGVIMDQATFAGPSILRSNSNLMGGVAQPKRYIEPTSFYDGFHLQNWLNSVMTFTGELKNNTRGVDVLFDTLPREAFTFLMENQ